MINVFLRPPTQSIRIYSMIPPWSLASDWRTREGVSQGWNVLLLLLGVGWCCSGGWREGGGGSIQCARPQSGALKAQSGSARILLQLSVCTAPFPARINDSSAARLGARLRSVTRTAMSCLDVMYQVFGPQPYFSSYGPYHHQVGLGFCLQRLYCAEEKKVRSAQPHYHSTWHLFIVEKSTF